MKVLCVVLKKNCLLRKSEEVHANQKNANQSHKESKPAILLYITAFIEHNLSINRL